MNNEQNYGKRTRNTRGVDNFLSPYKSRTYADFDVSPYKSRG